MTRYYISIQIVKKRFIDTIRSISPWIFTER